MKRVFATIFATLIIFSAMAEDMPVGYYNAATGTQDSILKSTLSGIIRRHTVLSYGNGPNSSWYCFYYSDQDSAGYCMDMYCDDWKKFTSPGAVVSGCNVEHSFAKSWWGGAENDAYKDCYHLNPSNSTANSSRSNYPLGIPTQDFKSSSVTGSLRVGKITENGQTFYVFEPKDEYKGDFARAYFYMATCYGDELTWRKDNKDVGSYYAMRNPADSAAYLEFLDWEIDVLLHWHRQDPVSVKELNRMAAVSDFQHNRNPFIDYPCLAEYIWGDLKGQPVNMAQLKHTYDDDWLSLSDKSGCVCQYTEPTLISPSSSAVNLGSANKNEQLQKRIYVRGALLSQPLTLSVTGTNASFFSVNIASIDTASANIGTEVIISYLPSAFGSHTALLTISSSEVSRTINLSGTCAFSFKALPATDITTSGFTANWTDAEVASYTLDVYTKQVTGTNTITVLNISPATQENISSTGNVTYEGKTYAESNAIRLGTGSGDGTITISNQSIGSGAKLIINAKAYGSDASALKVTADNSLVATKTLTTSAADYEFSIPQGTSTIVISQGTAGKRVVIYSIKLTQGGQVITKNSISGYPLTTSAVTSYYVATTETAQLYYTVTPLGAAVSDEVAVGLDVEPASVSETPFSYREINVTNHTLTVSGIVEGCILSVYDTSGRALLQRVSSAEEVFSVPSPGLYIIQVGATATKVFVP